MTSNLMHTVDKLPVTVISGEGIYLTDDKGNRYMDFWGDEGVASMGYGALDPSATGTQEVMNGIARPQGFSEIMAGFLCQEAPHRLPDMYISPLKEQVAKRLCESAGMDKVFFANSGAEGNETAIKLARRYWTKVREQEDRTGIVTIAGNFHGRTGFALAASDSTDSPYHKLGFGPMADGFAVVEDSLGEEAEDAVEIAAWDSESQEMRGDQYTYWQDVAAVIMAPILGNNVVKRYPEAFWHRLASLRKQHGFLIIFDEVQVGMGRVGTTCAYQRNDITYGVKPDIVVLGKGIACGLPAAAVLAMDDVARAFVPGVHFNTFAGSNLVCHFINHVLDYIDGNTRQLNDIETMVRDTWRRADWLKGFDGAGVHWGFLPDWEKVNCDGPAFCDEARNHGLLLVTHRKHGPIRFTPPLCVSTEEMREALARLLTTAHALISGSRR